MSLICWMTCRQALLRPRISPNAALADLKLTFCGAKVSAHVFSSPGCGRIRGSSSSSRAHMVFMRCFCWLCSKGLYEPLTNLLSGGTVHKQPRCQQLTTPFGTGLTQDAG